MSTSSPVPVLSEVLFYTPDDPYNFQADNRPVYHLDTNVRHLASSLVGIGYGEHTSVSGGLLTPGKAVELLSSGLIRYPEANTASLSSQGKRPILGLVFGATEAGLNRVIWASDHLDLETLGLDQLLHNPASDLLLVADCSNDPITAGNISAVSAPSASQIVIGKVKTYPYVTISSYSTIADSVSVAAYTTKANHHNLYGFSRMRNLLAMVDLGQTPLQYTKETFYQSDLGMDSINPMSAKLNSGRTQITVADNTTVSHDYTVMAKKVVKERYYTFKSADGKVDTVSGSTWSSLSYQTTLGGNGAVSYENYELAPMAISQVLTTPDYTENLDLFKNFVIEKYYQYVKTSYSNPTLYGKVAATATVFNPDGVAYQGGEVSRIIVWDFYEYDATSGQEKTRHRIVTTGPAANQLFSNTEIFPQTLVKLQ